MLSNTAVRMFGREGIPSACWHTVHSTLALQGREGHEPHVAYVLQAQREGQSTISYKLTHVWCTAWQWEAASGVKPD